MAHVGKHYPLISFRGEQRTDTVQRMPPKKLRIIAFTGLSPTMGGWNVVDWESDEETYTSDRDIDWLFQPPPGADPATRIRIQQFNVVTSLSWTQGYRHRVEVGAGFTPWSTGQTAGFFPPDNFIMLLTGGVGSFIGGIFYGCQATHSQAVRW